MAAVRRVLGHVCVEIAKGKRRCGRNKKEHLILLGEPCLVIAEGSSQGSKNYCRSCAKDILDRARQDLDQLGTALFTATSESIS